MHAKLTERQEKFAQLYVEAGNASEAYRRAGYSEAMNDKTVREAASRLLTNSNVLAMVSELKAEHAQRHHVTVDLLTKMLLEEREIAHQKGNTAVEAVMGLAKLHGKADLLMQNGEPAQPVIILTIGGEKTSSFE